MVELVVIGWSTSEQGALDMVELVVRMERVRTRSTRHGRATCSDGARPTLVTFVSHALPHRPNSGTKHTRRHEHRLLKLLNYYPNMSVNI